MGGGHEGALAACHWPRMRKPKLPGPLSRGKNLLEKIQAPPPSVGERLITSAGLAEAWSPHRTPSPCHCWPASCFPVSAPSKSCFCSGTSQAAHHCHWGLLSSRDARPHPHSVLPAGYTASSTDPPWKVLVESSRRGLGNSAVLRVGLQEDHTQSALREPRFSHYQIFTRLAL